MIGRRSGRARTGWNNRPDAAISGSVEIRNGFRLYSIGKEATMSDSVAFTHEEGRRKGRETTVYALSTCGFCKRGLQFLRDNSVDFSFVYVDDLPLETKNRIKQELRERFKKDVSFPFVVLDGEEALVGFIEPDWKLAFGIK
jgi:glutaredoxin-like protein NrdH